MLVYFRAEEFKKMFGYWFSVPYNAGFITDIKYSIKANYRSYNPANHEWFVSREYSGVAETILKANFPSVSIVYLNQRPEKETKQEPKQETSWNTSEDEWDLRGNKDKKWRDAKRTFAEQMREALEKEYKPRSYAKGINLPNGPYSVLGVSNNANWRDIDKAYRRLAKQYHPDKKGDNETILQINEAYEMLRKVFGK